MNKKLLLSIAVVGALNLTGCAALSTMMSTDADYKEKAAETLDIAEDNLTLDRDSIRTGLNDITFEVLDKEDNRYRCRMGVNLSKTTQASCKKRNADGKWEQFGKEVNIEEEFGESGGALFNFSLSGGSEKKSKKANRNASSLQSNPTTDDGVYTETVQPRNKPTIVIQPDEDETDAYRTNPTKTYNGKFKVRDEQGHSYECHFANVGQVVSDTISVCTKLY